jgi:uroporphyrinogen-III synthase
MIMTRPAGANESFAADLAPEIRAKLRIIHSPLIEILGTGKPVHMGAGDVAVFTSANGVRFAPGGEGRAAYCIGKATAAAALHAGWLAEVMGADADGLVDAIIEKAPVQSLFHICGVHTRGAVSARLRAQGIAVESVAVYDQKLQSLTATAQRALRGGAPVIVPLFSPRTAGQFARECSSMNHVHLIALSAAVAKKVSDLPARSISIAMEPTARSMAVEIEKLLENTSLG